MNALRALLRIKSLVQTKEALQELASAEDVPEHFRIDTRRLLEHSKHCRKLSKYSKRCPKFWVQLHPSGGYKAALRPSAI